MNDLNRLMKQSFPKRSDEIAELFRVFSLLRATEAQEWSFYREVIRDDRFFSDFAKTFRGSPNKEAAIAFVLKSARANGVSVGHTDSQSYGDRQFFPLFPPLASFMAFLNLLLNRFFKKSIF